MPGTLVVGSQWGDEGKGKVIDVLCAKSHLVVRYQGGPNAGHTLVVDGKKTVLHLIPSGILHNHIQCLIANGVVVDPFTIHQEIQGLKNNGYLMDNRQLRISDHCTMILPYHRALDAAREEAKGKLKIGTTGKGVGPAYEDRAARKALVFKDLFSRNLKEKIEIAIAEKNVLLKHYGKAEQNATEIYNQLQEIIPQLEPFRVADTSLLIHEAQEAKKNILFEGAQGTMLDILHGTYPYVTSSNTIAGSCFTGSGIGPKSVDKVIAITKAYATRVGSGPFPTELEDETGEFLQKEGNEFGSTTGRARRCGWLDLVALRYSYRVNGVSETAMMKLDCLSKLENIGICTSYRYKGIELKDFPSDLEILENLEPVYEYLPGWQEDIGGVKRFSDLPENCKRYIQRIEEETATPVRFVSVGPGREQSFNKTKSRS